MTQSPTNPAAGDDRVEVSEPERRLSQGQKWTAFELDGGPWYVVGIGPITDFLGIVRAPNETVAEWLVARLAQPQSGDVGAMLSHPRANVRPAYTDTMVGLLDAYEQAIWTWAQGCEIDDIKQRSVIGDSYNEGQRDDANKARIALMRQIDALTTDPTPTTDAARRAALEEAARALVQRLDAIHADSQYQSVWTVSQLHVGPYFGPTYTEELADLRVALATGDAA